LKPNYGEQKQKQKKTIAVYTIMFIIGQIKPYVTSFNGFQNVCWIK